MRIDKPSRLADQGAATERRLKGLGVSPGIAIGPAHIAEGGDLPVRESHLPETEIDAERSRFAEAVAVSLRQLRKLKAKASGLPESAAEEIGYLLDAHLAMLSNSRLVRGVDQRIARTRINAERAVEIEIDEIAESFASMRDAYLAARIEDIRVVGKRLIRNLIKKPYVTYSRLGEGAVILADELSPADTALMDPQHVAGFATEEGGVESHTAIVARALGLPAVLAVPGLLEHAAADDRVVIDGTEGIVIIGPCPQTIVEYEARRVAFAREWRHLARLRKLPAVTRDGVEIALEANLELPVELPQALANGAMGLGLVRSEFLYMNRDDLPSEDEQYAIFSALVRGMEGRPVTVRTFDLGGEKIARPLSEHIAEPANPALGLRAIRLSLRHPRLLDPQLAAMLRAADDDPLRILLPMISNPGEVREVREALERVARRLKRRGVRLPATLPPLGVMIEVPGAALAADALAAEADFFAIGTNDLIQYTLAIDRSDDQVAHLYNPLHPAVLRLIQFAIEAAARRSMPISICGEMAGDPRFAPLLLGLGLRNLSMTPRNIPRVKQRIRGLDMVAATGRARAIMDQSDSACIAALLDDFNTVTPPQ
ncbi:MAG: phosphoenolpyruvate--protein phosphotransferase [Alphaproteobacteria bacterium]|nr:MAG: phosphoenolpyruvate--protein phosphotransferase [Alphaproteobacteria bacterium]